MVSRVSGCLSRKDRELVLGALNSLGLMGDALGAFLGGSIAAELQHGSSDIDVYLLTESRQFTQGLSVTGDGRRIEIKPVSQVQLRRAVDLGRSFAATTRSRWQVTAGGEQLKLLTSLYLGEILFGFNELRELKASISAEAVRRTMMARHAMAAALQADDTAGALKVGDLAVAQETSAMAVRRACEVSLAGIGDIYCGAKFWLRRLRRHELTQRLGQEAEDLIYGRGLVSWSCFDGQLKRLLRERLLFANGLVGYFLLQGWDHRLKGDFYGELPRWRPRSQEAGEGDKRSPYFGVVRFSNGVGLAGPVRAYNVDPASAIVWLYSDGRQGSAIADELASAMGVSGRRGSEYVATAVRGLREEGLVLPDGWT